MSTAQLIGTDDSMRLKALHAQGAKLGMTIIISNIV